MTTPGNSLNITDEGAVSFDGSDIVSGTLPLEYGGTNASTFSHDTGIISYDDATSKLKTVAGPKITSDGYLINHKIPAFFATLSAGAVNKTGGGTFWTVEFDATLFNHQSVFDTSTYTFTAPVDGVYSFSAQLLRGSEGTSTSANLYMNFTRNAGTIEFNTASNITSDLETYYLTGLAKLEAGDTAKIVYIASGGTDNLEIYGTTTSLETYFTGYLIG